MKKELIVFEFFEWANHSARACVSTDRMVFTTVLAFHYDRMKACSFVLDKLETTPLRVVVFYAYLMFSKPPACLHQVM